MASLIRDAYDTGFYDMSESIGFVGGGRMAEALILGIIKAGIVDTAALHVAEPDQKRREFLAATGVHVYPKASEMVAQCTTIILAVKPQVMGSVLSELKQHVHTGHLLISIAAGISIQFIESGLAGCGCRIIRVMPNTPALVQEAASALSAGKNVSDADMLCARNIFDAVGKTVVLGENYMDAVTGLSGSGPAYVFLFIEALIDAGVKVGLARADAEVLALQTVLGSVKLAMATKEHPAQLRAMVTSPGGTTIAGLHKMQSAGFTGIIMDAVEAATLRSKELGG